MPFNTYFRIKTTVKGFVYHFFLLCEIGEEKFTREQSFIEEKLQRTTWWWCCSWLNRTGYFHLSNLTLLDSSSTIIVTFFFVENIRIFWVGSIPSPLAPLLFFLPRRLCGKRRSMFVSLARFARVISGRL